MLWHLSQGCTFPEIAEHIGTTAGGVKTSLSFLYKKMGARGGTHAVALALLNGLIGPHEDCGTPAAYARHHDADEPLCLACRAWNTERLAAPPRAPCPKALLPESIQLLKALDSGRTLTQLTDLWGVSKQKLERLTTVTYRALGVDGLPREERRPAALRIARQARILRPTPPRPAPLKPMQRVHPLSPQQKRVLEALAGGCSIATAADRLGLPRSTVASHLSCAYRKLDVVHIPQARRRAYAVKVALRHGLIDPEALA
jgi:DNA-binding NarL/FixJ family response regulator